ncbi:hypothetical protein BOC36_18670 [Burkholderia pseudomallei]|uniref:hypothetical protein n=1 Tax=Burkholderia pseudomallei TaxID=28450 RepID=UPI000A1A22AF|nr:hypothetical protein [Burkholderia pseudomallei]ARK54919.1 hypothetical protein BOC36_18670 [Burkholderia pseudomallei]
MGESFYTASLSRTQGRNAWAIIFRHPKRTDPSTGKEGLRVRQSLKTNDEAEAAALRDQMSALLASPQLWDLGAREQALALFDARIVDIFFYKLEGSETDFLGLRDGAIPLPSSKDGSDYRRALFLGTTGAGKTTALRQVIGTDPHRERFPSTSTAKTTVHETEVVLKDGPYRAVVTFFPMEDVREHLKECVSAAVLSAYRGESDADQMRRLLTHVNQRFRFSYVLGNGPIKEVDDFDGDDEDAAIDGEAPVSVELLKHSNEVLLAALSATKAMAVRYGDTLRQELNAADEKDQRVIDELFEDDLDNRTRDDETFQQVVDSLLDEIEERFALLSEGRLQKTKVGWPLSWTWETTDREAFIRAVSRFSSNYAPLFGTLLTPLVNGVRVSGPFRPTWARETPKLVLFDGEGLGHTPRSMATISTTLARRIDMVDAVILVDNATQPMQAAPVAAMKELVSSGNASKLIFAFTHFDLVGGDNLPTPAAKAHHVLASAENVLAAIGEDLGPFAERALRARLAASRVFLSKIDEPLDSSADGQRTAKQLGKLLQMIDEIVERPKPADSRPVYDRMNLVLAVERAAESFRNGWRPRLGLTMKGGPEKEHWTRVKALSRRLATGIADEYDTLRPVADLKLQLQQRLYVLLQNPVDWKGPSPSDDDKQHIFDAIAEELSRRLIELASRRIRTERLSEWRNAFDESGPGSTFRRAKVIAERVYDPAAPVPDIVPSPDRNAFLSDVAEVTKVSIESVGATLR